MLPFSQGEIAGRAEDFLEVAMTDPDALVTLYRSTTARTDYIERICRGGLPLAATRSRSSRDRWFDDYVRVSLARDVTELSKIRQGALLPTLLRRLAGQTGQVLNIAAAGRAVGLEPRTAEAYTKLLEDLFLIRRLDAWGRTLRARAAASPKIHVLDSGLAARLMGVTPHKLARLDRVDNLGYPPPVEVIEVTEGEIDLGGEVNLTCAPTDHRPVEPTVAYRFDYGGSSVVAAGDTVPCAGLDRLRDGAQALVHTVIRKDVIETIPIQRVLDTLDYHSSPAEAAQTAARAGMDTLVLTHYFPPPADGDGDEYRAQAAEHFEGVIEVGDDLHRVEI